MRHTVAVLALVAIASTACSHGHADLRKPSTQDDFGVQMAKMNLWREAMFRFQRAVEINPSDAMAHNNLAVAYEANGDFEKAAREYREALKLDRSNQYIQKNYSRHTEFMARNRKRQQREEKVAGARAAPAGSTTAATTASSAPAASSPTAPAASAPAAAAASAASPAPPSAGTSSAPPASTSNPPPQTPPAQAPPQTNPPVQNPNPQTPPAQTPPPSNPPAAPPSSSAGGSR